MKRALLIVLVLALLTGCVFVGREATYIRHDISTQDGTNTNNRLNRFDFDIDP